MSWHSAGTYRIEDGRGGAGDGAQRSPPQRGPTTRTSTRPAGCCGRSSRSMAGRSLGRPPGPRRQRRPRVDGLQDLRLARARDVWEPEEIFWGPEDTWLGDERYSGDRELTGPFGAVQMGLIYVNPEGPNGKPDPLAAARDIRETFRRMAMNDEETVALIAGGHTFGKTHGGRPQPGRARARGLSPSSTRASAGRAPSAARQGHDHQWPRGCVDAHPDHVGQRLRDPLRMSGSSPRAPPAPSSGDRRTAPGRTRCPTPTTLGQARPDDGDDGPLDASRPGLRADLEAFHGEPGPARGGVRQGVVQAVAPRHGTRLAILSARGSRSRSCGRTPCPRSTTSWSGTGTSPPQGQDPRVGAVRLPAGLHRVGVGRKSAAPTSVAGRTGRGSVSSRNGTGRSTSRPSWRRCCRPSSRSSRTSTPPSPAGPGSRLRT